MNRLNRGFARADLVACLACALATIALASVACSRQNSGENKAASAAATGSTGAESVPQPPTTGPPGAIKAGPTPSAYLLKDGNQLRGIHQSMLVVAREFSGVMPLPGLIDRLPYNGQETPGRGDEDITQNTTANLHAALIMQNYYAPELIISPLERNPRVKAKADNNYELYNPVNDVYWDPEFKADLATESNVSYANLVLFGERKSKQWGETMDSTFAVLSNRGPMDGKGDAKSFTCDEDGNWSGRVVFNDNHVETLNSTQSPHPFKNAAGEKKPDNFFAIDDGMNGNDVILSFTLAITKDGATLQWD